MFYSASGKQTSDIATSIARRRTISLYLPPKFESDFTHVYSREDRYSPYFHPLLPNLKNCRTRTTLDWRRTAQILEHDSHIIPVSGLRFLGRCIARRPRLSCRNRSIPLQQTCLLHEEKNTHNIQKRSWHGLPSQ